MAKKTPTFFLIDDDEDDRELFQLALQNADPDIRLLTANNGVKALELLENGTVRPDYIFLDLNMPLMGGTECLTCLKQNPLLSHIPVIIFSTSSDETDREILRQIGAADFMTKPSRISELATLLNHFIEHQIHNTHPI
jgi:CheY-like chemotaxis protein